MPAHIAKIKSNIKQTKEILSFRGGIPNIPDRFSIPLCVFCKSEMTFFYQVAFPKKHIWADQVVAFFQCTSYSCDKSKSYGYSGRFSRIFVQAFEEIVDNILLEYQDDFQIYVFPNWETTILRNDFKLKLQFEKIDFVEVDGRKAYPNDMKLGGRIDWGNLFPHAGTRDKWTNKEISYMGGGIDFLMQIPEDWGPTRLASTPFQFEHYSQYPNPKHQDLYSLFDKSALKIFGTNSPELDPQQVLIF